MMLSWAALLVLLAAEPDVCLVNEAEATPLLVRTRAELASALGGPVTVVPTDTASCVNLVVIDEAEHRIVLRLSGGSLVIEEPYDAKAPLSVVASHVAEMLRAALLEVETREAARAQARTKAMVGGGAPVTGSQPSAIPPAEVERASRAPTPAPSMGDATTGRVTLSPGVLLGVGGLGPAPVVLADVTVRAWRWGSWGVTVLGPLGSLTVRVPEGTAWLRPVAGWVSVFASLFSNERWLVALGVGVGARWSHVEGRAVAPFEGASGDGVAALFAAEARLDVRVVGPWCARVAASAQTDAPRLTVETAGVAAANFGRLIGVLSIGVGVSW